MAPRCRRVPSGRRRTARPSNQSPPILAGTRSPRRSCAVAQRRDQAVPTPSSADMRRHRSAAKASVARRASTAPKAAAVSGTDRRIELEAANRSPAENSDKTMPKLLTTQVAWQRSVGRKRFNEPNSDCSVPRICTKTIPSRKSLHQLQAPGATPCSICRLSVQRCGRRSMLTIATTLAAGSDSSPAASQDSLEP